MAIVNGESGYTQYNKLNILDELLVRGSPVSGSEVISQESDFAVQDATTITLEAQTNYLISATFSTAKRFIAQNGSSWQSGSQRGHAVTYTGTGNMFTGSDVSFYIHDTTISCPTAQAFEFTDTVEGLQIFIAERIQIDEAEKWGTFNGMLAAENNNSNSPDIDDGITIGGTNPVIVSNQRLAMTSTSVSFIGFDLGSASISIAEWSDLFFIAPSGAIGISGLASSGNVPTGFSAMVVNSSFSGGMTDLQNITTDDIRWLFRDNTPTKDTFPDALISFRSNATETVVSTQDVPVIVNATWVEQQVSFFTSTSAGRLTYNGERDLPGPIDISCGLISSGGGSITVTVYIASNGSVLTASGVPIDISGNSAQTLSIPWQGTISEDDFVEVFVENNSNTTNIIVEYATFRIR